MSFLVNASPLKLFDVATSILQIHRPHGVEANSSYDIDPKVKVKGQIIHFLVNASPPKLLDVTTSNSSSAQVT